MAFLVVLSASGVAVSKHLCKGEVKNMAIFHIAKSCDHAKNSTTIQCPIHKDMVIHLGDDQNNKCCSDTTELIKDDHPQIDCQPFEMPDVPMVIVCMIQYSGINITLSSDSDLDDHFLHLPPLINLEIPIRVHSLLL